MNKKSIFKIIGVVFSIFLIWRIYLLIFGADSGAGRRFDRPPVAVEVDTARYAPIEETNQLTGTVVPLYQYIIAPKISGRIIKINKRIGDWIHQNEFIAKIDDAEYVQAKLEAEANLKISEANLAEIKSQYELAKQELERIQSLQKKGIASPAELDASATNFSALQSRIKLAQAQVEQRQAALNSAKIRLSYTILSATEPGFVGERFVDEGSLLSPNSPVISVLGIDTVIVRTTVIERVYGQMKIGQSAEIIVDAFPSKIFKGTVSRIAPMLQEASRVAQMEVEVVNENQLLKPGMFAKVKVVLARKENTQIVPSQAIVNRSGQTGIFIIKAGEKVAHFTPTEIGITTQQNTEIISPKIEGLVVTLGQHLLEDGSNIILPEKSKDK